MSARSKTIKKREGGTDMAGYSVSPGNFWDIGNYNRCVKKISEYLTLDEELVKMYTERADIESKYSKRLTDWNAKWSRYLDESSMYATMKMATLGTLKEAEDRAKIHMDCWSKIHDHVENIKRHKEAHYHKALLGIKEAKDYDEEFSKAQKPWAAAYGKVHRSKKNYHSACKTQEHATHSLNEAQGDSETPLEKIKKFEDALKKAEKQVEMTKAKYNEKLSRIEPLNTTYEQEMRKVYDKWSKDEERRKDYMQRTLVDFHKAVNICSDNRLKECFDNQLNVAYSGKSQYDVKWYSENFGADMARNWPKFEVYSALGYHRWSSHNMSSSQQKKARRYTTRPRGHPYLVRNRAYSYRKCRKLKRRFTFLGVRQSSMQNYTDSFSSHSFNDDFFNRQLAKCDREDIEAMLDKSSNSSSRNNPFDSPSSIYQDSLSCMAQQELGDVPETPPAISAVEPPPSHSYTTQSTYNQNTTQAAAPPMTTYNQPPTQSYEPVADSASNPFMNGDAKDGDDDDDDDWDEPPPIPGGGIPVRALYDYTKVEEDELSFNAGDILTKLTEEDEQGWCRGRINDLEGLYPANYVEPI